MRTDVSKQQTSTESQSSKSSESVETMKVRKSLHPLQVAAGDKENLVGAGRMPPSGKEENKTIKKVIPSSTITKIEKKKHPEKKKTDKKITVEDLTSQSGPSEHYWEVIAERRRLALENALEENRKLHEQIAALKEENEHCRTVLEESKTVIDTLMSMVNEDSSESANDVSFVSGLNEDEMNQSRDE